jgi:hypothetical protein
VGAKREVEEEFEKRILHALKKILGLVSKLFKLFFLVFVSSGVLEEAQRYM